VLFNGFTTAVFVKYEVLNRGILDTRWLPGCGAVYFSRAAAEQKKLPVPSLM
jgi:hypothetical protein